MQSSAGALTIFGAHVLSMDTKQTHVLPMHGRGCVQALPISTGSSRCQAANALGGSAGCHVVCLRGCLRVEGSLYCRGAPPGFRLPLPYSPQRPLCLPLPREVWLRCP